MVAEWTDDVTTEKAAQEDGFFLCPLRGLFLNVRKQAHKSSALYCRLDCTLLLGGESCALARNHTAVRIDELLQEVHIFVVYVLNIILCEYVCHI